MPRLRFDRMEFAGSLGDLGTLLPIAVAMVLFNGINPTGLFFSIGVFYIASGLFFGVPVPVQPMKVIGAYAIATAMSAEQILASSLIMGGFLAFIGLTGAIDFIQRITPVSVIRGVQISTGILLISTGIRFIIGTSRYQAIRQAVEPHLTLQSVGPIPISLLIGVAAATVTLLFLDNRRYPAGLIVVLGGLATGLLFGARFDITKVGFYMPRALPFGLPQKADFTFAIFALALPQLPMTLGNAVLSYTDLSKKYFGNESRRVTNKNACLSMAAANLLSFFFGGMPLCHGAGGLAAHYRFGARTAASNLIIGLLFGLLAILLGENIVSFFNLLPMSVLGALLVFAGSQLALTIMDLRHRKEYFVATMIIGITLASNLAAGFISGIVVARLLEWNRLSV